MNRLMEMLADGRAAGIAPGDEVRFGRHVVTQVVKPPDEPGPTRDILWRVLEREGDRLLLLSAYILDWELFGEPGEDWQHCYLRRALLGEYMEQWFTAREQRMLMRRPDPVFLLTAQQARRYLPSPQDRAACLLMLDDARMEHGQLVYEVGEYPKEWWLRTPGRVCGQAACVWPSGEIDMDGYDPTSDEFGVRPAIWVDMERYQQ